MFNANYSSVVLINSKELCEFGAELLYFCLVKKIIICKEDTGLYKFPPVQMMSSFISVRVIWFVALSRQERI